jgi:hypothetical protein
MTADERQMELDLADDSDDDPTSGEQTSAESETTLEVNGEPAVAQEKKKGRASRKKGN